MPASRRAGMSLANCSALRTSETVTWEPRRCRNSAAAKPDFPSPTTRTFLPLSSIIRSVLRLSLYFHFAPPGALRGVHLTEFQRGECKQCKHQGADPEAHDDL